MKQCAYVQLASATYKEGLGWEPKLTKEKVEKVKILEE